MFKIWTLEEAAADAFEKAEIVKCHEAANTPMDYEERKRAFIELTKARLAAIEAQNRLEAVINREHGKDTKPNPQNPYSTPQTIDDQWKPWA